MDPGKDSFNHGFTLINTDGENILIITGGNGGNGEGGGRMDLTTTERSNEEVSHEGTLIDTNRTAHKYYNTGIAFPIFEAGKGSEKGSKTGPNILV
jgi:hypothetical protein